MKKLSLPLFITFAFVLSCTNNNKEKSNDPFISSLSESSLGNTGYKVSIPKDYTIRQKGGEDFMVYYITTNDSTIKAAFSAGMYFGDAPTEFSTPADSCNISTSNYKILGKDQSWKQYNCSDSLFFVQTIIDNKNKQGSKIHAFGRGTSRENLKKVMDIFSTMK
jgi:hypothetical protein